MKAPTDVSIRSRHLGSREGATRKASAPSLPEHAKLSVGRSDHPLEYDARRLADEIMRVPESGARPSTHRPGNDPAQEMKEGASEDGLSDAPPVVNEVLREQGHPLDPTTRDFFESRFGHDFSRVRIHADSVAASAARSVSANAFTLGSDVVFGASAMSRSEARQHLLAHELAHVVQQGGRSHAILRRDGRIHRSRKRRRKMRPRH
jgi:hypothetical protein